MNTFYSHKDCFVKRHSNRNETSCFLWKYGVIPFGGVALIVDSSEEQLGSIMNTRFSFKVLSAILFFSYLHLIRIH